MFYSFLGNNHLIRGDIVRDFFIHYRINSSYCMHLFTTTDFICSFTVSSADFFAVRFTNGGFRCILVFAFFHSISAYRRHASCRSLSRPREPAAIRPRSCAACATAFRSGWAIWPSRFHWASRRATPGSTPFRAFWSACSTTLPRANTRGSPPSRPMHPIWKSRW